MSAQAAPRVPSDAGLHAANDATVAGGPPATGASPALTMAAALALGTLLMGGLFWLLHAVIGGGHGSPLKGEVLPTIDFVRLDRQFEVETRERKPPPKIPDRPEAPPEAPTPQMDSLAPVSSDVTIGSMDVENTTSVRSNIGLSASDGEYLPIVKVAPIYPPRAQTAGTEGWVLLEFTVTETGEVRDALVIEAQPPGTFDEAAKKAVLKFRYKPRVVGGRAVAVPRVQHLITFKIEKDRR